MQNQRDYSWYPAYQRQVILTFDTVEEAEAWDTAGQPLHFRFDTPLTTRPGEQDPSR